MERKYEKGYFLIANPVLPDPNFSRTVVLLCNHDEQGSFGLVVNKKSELRASEIFSKSELLEFYQREVFMGGPVSQSQVFYLCRSEEPLPGLEYICEGIYLGMTADDLEQVIPLLKDPKDDVRFYLGYSGWGSGQLAGEMEQRSWLTCAAQGSFIFDDNDDKVWARVVKSLGKDYEYLLQAPVDPRVN